MNARLPLAALAPPAPLIELARASVHYGPVRALDALTLAIHAGERVALIGHNGSGKTTLLRVLHDMQRCDGVRRAHAPLRQAMVFQRPFLLRLSVAANMRLALWLAGVPRAERAARACAALGRVGLDGLSARPARALSGGQQQRLALARAWALHPEVLFLDEPTASLDPIATKAVEDIIRTVSERNIKVVMATHDLGEARRLAGDVVMLHRGRVVETGTAASFFDRPQTAEARAFLAGELLI
jgi:tungstate transport system ATP-binding protein